jgi:hypothetical protein
MSCTQISSSLSIFLVTSYRQRLKGEWLTLHVSLGWLDQRRHGSSHLASIVAPSFAIVLPCFDVEPAEKRYRNE